MMEIVDRIKNATHIVGDVDRESVDIVPQMSTDDLVAFGQRVWWLNKRLNKTFELVKVRLREIALARAAGVNGPQRLEALDGSHAIVMIQPEAMTLKKTADMTQVAEILGNKFGLVFETVTTYRPRKDFQEQIQLLDADEAATAMAVIDMTDLTPKVMFKD